MWCGTACTNICPLRHSMHSMTQHGVAQYAINMCLVRNRNPGSPSAELISTQVAVAPWSRASSRMPSTLLWLSWVYTNCEPSCQENASATSFNAPATLQKIMSLLAEGMPLQLSLLPLQQMSLITGGMPLHKQFQGPATSEKIVSLLAKGMHLQLASEALQRVQAHEPCCQMKASVTNFYASAG